MARIGDMEGWIGTQRLLVAVRRLEAKAKEWHMYIGYTHANWEKWWAALIDAFNPRVPCVQWLRLVGERRQKGTETGSEYAMARYRIPKISPMPLGEAKIVNFLIEGLYDAHHKSEMIASSPPNFQRFLTRIMELEAACAPFETGVETGAAPYNRSPSPGGLKLRVAMWVPHSIGSATNYKCPQAA